MSRPRPLTQEEIATLVGNPEDAIVAAILAIGPTAEELEEALAWVRGEDDVMGEMERPLTGKAALVYDILTADENEDDRPR